jgi:hypothetical protein
MACTPPFCLGTGGWCGCNCGCCPPCPVYTEITTKWWCGSSPIEVGDPCNNGLPGVIIICDAPLPPPLRNPTNIEIPDLPDSSVESLQAGNLKVEVHRKSGPPRGFKKTPEEAAVLRSQADFECDPFLGPAGPYTVSFAFDGCGLAGSYPNFTAVGSGLMTMSTASTICGPLVGLANGFSSSIELEDCDSVVISFNSPQEVCCNCCLVLTAYTIADYCGGGTVDPCNPSFRITNSKTGKAVRTNRYALLNKIKKTLRQSNPNP